jgi:tryptophan-rich sensory protein
MQIGGRHASAFVTSAILVIATAYYGSKWTNESVNSKWYDCIRPSFTPPSVVFPIVWSVLYFGLFIAFFNTLVSLNALVTGLFLVNLMANVLWCYLFFGRQSPRKALYAMGVLLMTSIGIIGLSTSDLWVVVPVVLYAMWLGFAMVLNLSASMKEKECQTS